MKIILFYHSLISDWNHGNAHFLRGICTELIRCGHEVTVMEPEDNWSLKNLLETRGDVIWDEFKNFYPKLKTQFYDPQSPDFSEALLFADLVLVHEWNEHHIVKILGALKQQFGYKLLFHDTHHRAVTDKDGIADYDLSKYDGVLAFGNVIRDLYLQNKWAKKAWTWHEAADTEIFKPLAGIAKTGDLVWVGNWGDDERTEELIEFLIKPVQTLGLKATMYGVRYPEHAIQLLQEAGIHYGGYIPSYQVPQVIAQHRFTVHIPRRPYTQFLPGIPTIRPFEALACGIPLISAPWQDTENLFQVGDDFLMVKNGEEMTQAMQQLLANENLQKKLSKQGLETIAKKHNCQQRVKELINIYDQINEKIII